ncbi:hypothetical protein FSP39_009162 [Pinctada imbricata]|uniref:Vacuolar protein sorting-associated protein VTA1-like protein n=1 Tax=Pinctada imbricata TaxID=66713 RepID=A0AA88YI52_PINIB|nr:hypothetical protein FSP39_009162 [Pinctada imbricata]
MYKRYGICKNIFYFSVCSGRLYAMQKGMEIDKKSPDCRNFLLSLMDYLEKLKSTTPEEAISNEVVGQAHLENYALKVFLYADNEDRASRFNKNVVKSFYTAGMLFDVMGVFGEISEEIEKNRKYAKWKAAYIHKCLKAGETPIPGPMQEEGDEFQGDDGTSGTADSAYPSSSASMPPPQPGPSTSNWQPYGGGNSLPPPNNSMYPAAGAHAPPSTPQDPGHRSPQQPKPVPQQEVWQPPENPSGVQLHAEDYQKAMKYCKYASSALQYEDPSTAISNLTKALKLLTTGKET